MYISDLAAWCAISFGLDKYNPWCYAHKLYLNRKLITNLVIPSGVTSIGDGAFYGCTGLTSITCEAVTPPTLGSNTFFDVYKSIPVYVPAGSVSAYRRWGGFTNILPIPGTGLEDVKSAPNTTDSKKILHNGKIFILRDGKAYDLTGIEL